MTWDDDDERRLTEVTRALLRPGGLQDQAEAALRRALAADPHDTGALWKLAETHRRQGNFAAARRLYRRLRGRGPEPHKAAWLHAMLNGNGAPEPAPGGIWPAPFVRMTNFLAPGECDRLLTLGVAARERFVPAQVGKTRAARRTDPDVRITLEADARTQAEFRPRIAPKIRSLAPRILARLRMDDGDRYVITMNMRVYPAGGFYQPHLDRNAHAWTKRLFSFVYFFNRQPPRFSGGDLLLYDTDADSYDCSWARFSRIVPLRNSIVFFPSACWHQATPVRCGTDDFGDLRWVVNGHVERRDRDAGETHR